MNALSLFSGIGGLDVAATAAGFTVTAQVEIDPYCRQILCKHAPRYWPQARIFEDVREVTAEQIGAVDLIFGGFPCQDISIAGKQAGIQDGTRSGLYFEFLRLIRDLRPRAVILENVANIAVQGLDIVAGTLAEIGYDAIWTFVRASDAGAPHQRERWFCIAIPDSDSRRREQCYKGKRSISELNANSQALGNADQVRLSEQLVRQRSQSAKRHRSNQSRSKYGTQSRLDRAANGLSGWLDFPGFPARPNEAQHDYEPPRVTPTKAQTQRVNRIKALGNAVVPQQAYPFFEAAYRLLTE